jgi:hypothetical protein
MRGSAGSGEPVVAEIEELPGGGLIPERPPEQARREQRMVVAEPLAQLRLYLGLALGRRPGRLTTVAPVVAPSPPSPPLLATITRLAGLF